MLRLQLYEFRTFLKTRMPRFEQEPYVVGEAKTIVTA